MTKLKKQLASLPENERIEIAQELIQSLGESGFNKFFQDFFSPTFKGKIKNLFKQWLKINRFDNEKEAKAESLSVAEIEGITGEEMKAWIAQQIAKSESNYADEMKNGNVKTFTLEELKAGFNGKV